MREPALFGRQVPRRLLPLPRQARVPDLLREEAARDRRGAACDRLEHAEPDGLAEEDRRPRHAGDVAAEDQRPAQVVRQLLAGRAPCVGTEGAGGQLEPIPRSGNHVPLRVHVRGRDRGGVLESGRLHLPLARLGLAARLPEQRLLGRLLLGGFLEVEPRDPLRPGNRFRFVDGPELGLQELLDRIEVDSSSRVSLQGARDR